METENTENAPPSILWGEDAVTDLRTIINFIQQRNPSAAEGILDEIEDRVDQLSSFPRQGRPGRVSGTRELVVEPTYVVVYTESESEVVILRVLHTSQQWP